MSGRHMNVRTARCHWQLTIQSGTMAHRPGLTGKGGQLGLRTRGSGFVLLLLFCVILSACGSSANGPTPTAVPQKTADLAAIQSHQATAVAAANQTSVAVQVIARTAVARLQSTANEQTRSQNAANAQATANARPTATTPPVSARPTRRTAAPTATSRPGTHPTSSSRPKTPSSIKTLASITCCTNREFKRAGEKVSSAFGVTGSWILRWTTRCTNVAGGRQPIIYIAIIPVGSHAPIQFIQEPMPAKRAGSGIANESLHGRFYLDVISPCHNFFTAAHGPRGARVSPSTQASALSEARSKGQGAAFNAVRQSLIGTKSSSSSRAKAKASARARAVYIADLTGILSQVKAARKTLSTAAGSIDPTSPDFNPSLLKTTRDFANAANQELLAAKKKLSHVKKLPAHGKLKTIVAGANLHLRQAADFVLQAADAMQSGDTSTAASDLDAAQADIAIAQSQIKHARKNLKTLKKLP